jgi:exodeoxyribonuclease VII large subunit
MPESQANVAEFTVSELSAALRRTVEDAYGYVRVRGEVSGYKGPSPSGHVYFRLKDDKAVLESVIWKGTLGRMRFKPEEGLEVIASGRLTTFAGSSKYQIVIEALEPAGVGALMALLEERKRKLAAEGLFDDARKQLIPYLPEVIGVVTSPTGAVIRDILHRLADRFPRHVIVWPVKVQGDGSAEQVAAAIRGFNAMPEDGRIRRPDLLIVARGGGSLEDLWSFNEEIVVRAAADSLIPLISAVGHETDFTLIDFAADKRAPTPTAAAEMAVPVRADLIAELMSKARRALACWQRAQDHRRTELRAAARALPSAEELLAGPRQRLDACAERLPRALWANAQIHHTQFSRVSGRLSPQLLRTAVERRRIRLDACTQRLGTALKTYRETQLNRVSRARDRVSALAERSHRALQALIATREARLERSYQLLRAFSYQSVLERGFALVRDRSGHPLRSAAAVTPGMPLDIELADGCVGATAQSVRQTGEPAPVQPSVPTSWKPRKPKTSTGGSSGQGSLFGS